MAQVDSNEEEIGPLLTIRQFCQKHKGEWPSESSMRSIIFGSTKWQKKFHVAFVRIGRRILISEKLFIKVLQEFKKEKVIK